MTVGKLTGPKPPQIINILPRHLNVHTPHATEDVHGQYDGTKHSKLAKNVGSLFLALVHQDVDLRQIVGMRARQ